MLAERLIIGPLALLIGALFCFAGYRLFRVIMAIWGFLLGFFIGMQITSSLLANTSFVTGAAWTAGIVLGLALAILAYALYTAAMTLLGAGIGYVLGTGLMTGLGIGNQMILVVVVGLVLAILFAILILALDLARLLIVVNTAMGGSASIVVGVLLLYQYIPTDFLHFDQLSASLKASPAWLLLWLALAVGGGFFQMQNTRRYQLEKYVLARKVTRS
ncbi:MAG TPA: DUF4203 domain-containing protein [Ktedonobacteraceae bacterium]